MKTISPEVKEFIESLDQRDFSLEDLESEEDTFIHLFRHGIIHPYGDTFAYDGKAVLICGDSGIGKTHLVEKFKRELGDRVQILAKDDPILYWDGKSNPVTYEDDINSNDYPFFVPFLFPGEAPEFELNSIVHLKADGSRKVRSLDISDREVSGYLIESNNHNRTPELERILTLAMAGVHVFEYGKNQGYHNAADLDLTYRDIVSRIDGIRSS